MQDGMKRTTFMVVGVVLAAALIGSATSLSTTGTALSLTVAVAVLVFIAIKLTGPVDGQNDEPQHVDILRTSRRMWAPLWFALIWLVGTYGAFWTTILSEQVADPWSLNVFIGAATGAFTLGYAVRIKTLPPIVSVEASAGTTLLAGKKLLLAGSIYLATFGVVQILEYGATSLSSVASRIQNPGRAYQAKFGVYAVQQAVERVSAPMQVVTLLGALYGITGPLLVVFWSRLSLGMRLAGVGGLTMYGIYFLFIGTQKGLGDIVVMLIAGTLAGTFGTWWTRKRPRVGNYRAGRLAALAIAGFAIYMVSAQAARAEQFGTRHITPPNPVIAAAIGDHLATGVAATLFYPTHGYLGLSYNLQTPFEWSRGLGGSPVIASYAGQYFDAAAPQTYPIRTEERTGWPAGMYWATIYPWLASDFTFPGAVVFMFILGWLFAKMWVEGAVERDALALIIFGQLVTAVAYVPANNQIGVSRPATIGLFTLAAIYIMRYIKRGAVKRKAVREQAERSPA